MINYLKKSRILIFTIAIILICNFTVEGQSEFGEQVVVRIDNFSKLPDKPFPFDENFIIIYTVDKGYEADSIEIVLLTRNKNDKLRLPIPPVNRPSKAQPGKTEIVMFVPPLPPGKTFDITIQYKSNPKTSATLETLYNICNELEKVNDLRLNNLKCHFFSQEPCVNPPKEVSQELNWLFIGILDVISDTPTTKRRKLLGYLFPKDVPRPSRQIQKKENKKFVKATSEILKSQNSEKDFKKAASGLAKEIRKAFPDQSIIDSLRIAFEEVVTKENDKEKIALSFLIKYLELSIFFKIEDKKLDFVLFPDLFKMIADAKPEQIKGFGKKLASIHSKLKAPLCCKDIEMEIIRNKRVFHTTSHTFRKLQELNSSQLESLVRGEISLSPEKIDSDAKTLSQRLSHIEQNIPLLLQLKSELALYDFCNSIKCITELSEVIESIVSLSEGVKSQINHSLNELKLNSFEIITEYSSRPDFESSIEGVVQPDIGVVGFTLDGATLLRPFYGVNINLRSIKKDKSFKDIDNDLYDNNRLWNQIKFHSAIEIGATIGSIDLEDSREDLFNNTNLMIGAAFRWPFTRAGLRLSGGALLYNSVDNANPLFSTKNLDATFYIAFKADINIGNLISSFSGLFIN